MLVLAEFGTFECDDTEKIELSLSKKLLAVDCDSKTRDFLGELLLPSTFPRASDDPEEYEVSQSSSTLIVTLCDWYVELPIPSTY